jgi:hypothetical protein
MVDLLKNIANVWSLTLLAAVAASLLWFIYSVCLRKLIRARKISSAREKRLLKEAALRE